MIAIPEPTDLCRLAEKHDTDKGTLYTQTYHRWLGHVREQRLRMLEIGLYNGGSLRMWRDYLPNSVLHGIDIDARTLAYQDEVANSQVRLVDQGDPAALDAFVAELGGNYDFILDDGGHTMVQQIVSFEVLWPQIMPGGIYAIEDLGTSYFVEYGGQELRHPDTAVDYVKDLADAVQRDQAVRPPDGVRSAVGPIALAKLRRDVASVHVHPGLALIVKKF
jgi:predicted O-methyltransferase YrrM